ncbi:hypothetical protein HWV62_27299 [Athelia sp. TMB]|nr:hypothetical protein HWV62_27299 [Athelia sp. TMB]
MSLSKAILKIHMPNLQCRLLLADVLSLRKTFYRKEVESGIHSEPSKSAVEKMKMMELLKRLEQESVEEDLSLLENDDDDDDNDLVQRLEGVDLELTSTDQLWARLTPEERAKFLKALDNPDSELAQQLLASEELESDRVEPWWDAPSIEIDSQPRSKRRFGSRPIAMALPAAKPGTPQVPTMLIYNILAVFIAYAYATRYFATSPLSSFAPDEPEWKEARRIVSQLAPFLTDRSSKVLHPNLGSVITDLWSRFDSNTTVDGKMMSMILQDAAKLIRPSPVIVLDSSTTSPVIENSGAVSGRHPCVSAILVLSDLSKLFGRTKTQKGDAGSQGSNHVTLKLLFYAVQIISTPTVILTGLAEEAALRSKVIEREAVLPVHGAWAGRRTEPAKQNKGPKIEEMP